MSPFESIDSSEPEMLKVNDSLSASRASTLPTAVGFPGATIGVKELSDRIVGATSFSSVIVIVIF